MAERGYAGQGVYASADGAFTVGGQLRHMRLAAGLTQQALAEAAGISVDAVAALENGRRRTPRADTMRRLLGVLGPPDSERDQLMRTWLVAREHRALRATAGMPG